MTSLASPQEGESSIGGIGLRWHFSLDPRARLNPDREWRGLSLADSNGYFEWNWPTTYKQAVKIDSTGKFIIATEKVLGEDVRLPQILTFDQFTEAYGKENRHKLWLQAVLASFSGQVTAGRAGAGGLNIDIPVPIKSKAFQKIFGGNTVGLNVQGDIRIDGGFRNEKRSEVRTSIAQGSNTNFKMNQTQRFQVTGKIGEKVTVNVDQDSERAFEFDNNIKLNYTGFEDEIIQSIEAGNISLSLPATRFVTFSGKSTGLFGVKANMQLGNLSVTTIASQEKGESQRLSVGGGASSGSQKIPDYQYKRYTYFFLDDFFRQQYTEYRVKWEHLYDPNRAISRIQVYKSQNSSQQVSQVIQAWALPDPSVLSDTTKQSTSKEYFLGNFVRLELTDDYYVENSLGYIILNQPLSRDEVLAVAYEDTSGRVVGDLDYDQNTQSRIFLKIIKPESPIPSYTHTWNLEWKNVYSLGGHNIPEEGFSIKINYLTPSNQLEDSQGQDSYLKIFGLDVSDKDGNPNPDGVIDINPAVVNLARGELIFPNPRPFDPVALTVGGATETTLLESDKFESAMYDTTSQSEISLHSKFTIEVTSQSRSASYQLGFNVIEGSEKVVLNGAELKKGTDYTIDYFSGNLILLNESATLPNANLDITYERNQLFQLEKKSILGTRAEYRLNQNSFIGGTVLYLNERTLDQKVRVGRGPMRNLVWDLNTSLKFKPNFLTRGLDALPLIRAQQPSALNFEGEIAQIIPNPNTLNNDATGDKNGVAYIDDFEGAKRPTPLGVQRKGWTLASAPVQKVPGNTQEEYWQSDARLGRLVWYNPYGGVAIQEIYPKREVNSQTAQTTDVLYLRFTPEPQTGTVDNTPPTEYWSGVLRALSAGFYDQTESKFLEVMVQGDVGKLHIDLGQLSEDVIPNKKLDSEDKPIGGQYLRILDSGEDIGLDGMAGSDNGANPDYWDINKNGQKEPFEPFSFDDWAYSSGSRDYEHIDGTENNANDGTKIPDTEDLNGNNNLDLANNYFEYTFDLDKTSPDTAYIANLGGLSPDEDYGWRLYRIPLEILAGTEDRNRRRVGNPDLSLIEFARIWVDGVDQEALIGIADISLVGNEWKERGISDSEDPASYNVTNDSTVAVSVVNTHENPAYVPPPGVEGVRDRITNVRAKEQALVLEVNGLQSGYNGIVQKSLYESQNYIRYKRMRMFVFAKDEFGTHIQPDSSDIEFFLRFGADANNYYEVRERVYGGSQPTIGAWDQRNAIDLELLDITSMKLDSVFYNAPEQYFERRIGNKIYRMKGTPSITNVRVLVAGVKNLSSLDQPFKGEIWLNELRLSDIQKEKGMAMRARVDLSLSDLMTVNAEINRKDADFHNVATRFGDGDNSVSTSINGNLSLDKLLPQSWGLALPLTVNYAQSQSTPKYYPRREDIEVTGRLPASELEKIRSKSRQQGFSLSFRKTSRSKNFFIKNSLDNITASVSQTKAVQSSPTVKFSNRTAWSGNVGYNLQFGQNTYIQPFSLLAGLPLLEKVGKTKLYYLPRTINASVQANTSRSSSLTLTSTGSDGARSDNYTYDITRSYTTTVKIFDNLSTNFARTFVGDFREKQWVGLFSGGYVDLNKTQSFKADYSPDVLGWLGTKFSYSSNYRYTNNIQQKETGKSAGTSNSASANLTLKLAQIFKATSKKPAPGGRPQPGGRREPPGERRPPPGEKKGEVEENDKQKPPGQKNEAEPQKPGEQEAKPRRDPLIVLKAIRDAVGKFRDVNFSIARRTTYNNLGLVEGDPTFKYSLGLTSRTGLATVSSISTNTFTQSIADNYDISTGVQVAKNFDVQLRFNHDEQKNQTTQTTGSYSDSWMQLGDFDLPFPEWTITWSGLEKVKLLTKYVQSLSLSHNFSGKRSVVWNRERDQKTKEDFSISFRPLLKIALNWKNGMSTNIQLNRTRGLNSGFQFNSLTSELTGTGAQRTTSEDLSVSTTYSKRSGFKIPLPFLRNKELKNSVDLSVTFTKSQTTTETLRAGQKEWVTLNVTDRWSFIPQLTYSFSTRVRGGAKFEVGKTFSTQTGTTSIKEFGIDVNISIRGG